MAERILALLLAASIVCGVSAENFAPYMMGGDDAVETAYAASLRIDKVHVCSATIVSNMRLLTTANCVIRKGQVVAASRLGVRVGTTNIYAGGLVEPIDKVIIHPKHNGALNNVAVLILKTPLTWTARIKPIELATGDDELPRSDTLVSVAGWGHNEDAKTSYKLLKLSLKLASQDDCENGYSGADDKLICLDHELNEGACYGDGGSAAVVDNKMIGMTSFVVGACGSIYPDVYVRVSRYADWVLSPDLE